MHLSIDLKTKEVTTITEPTQKEKDAFRSHISTHFLKQAGYNTTPLLALAEAEKGATNEPPQTIPTQTTRAKE